MPARTIDRVPHPTTAHFVRPALLAGVASLLALASGCGTAAKPSACPGSCESAAPAMGRPTDAFRLHHADIREHLNHIDGMAEALPGQSSEEQRKTMLHAVTFLKDHIATHAAEEERVLYPVVERQAGAGSRLTEVPIHEHRLVERSIQALDREASKPSPDAAAFAREAMHLVGLLEAHFSDEEDVLLPVLDATMTREQFTKDVADKMSH